MSVRREGKKCFSLKYKVKKKNKKPQNLKTEHRGSLRKERMVRKIQLTWLPLLPWSSYASWRGPSLELSAYMRRVKKWCSGLVTRMWKIVTKKEMSKHAIIFTGRSVHHGLDLYLEKAGLKKRIRHSCSDLSNLAALVFLPRLMGSEWAN